MHNFLFLPTDMHDDSFLPILFTLANIGRGKLIWFSPDLLIQNVLWFIHNSFCLFQTVLLLCRVLSRTVFIKR